MKTEAGNMKVKRFVCGFIEENGYVIYHKDGGCCYVIDPGEDAGQFLGFMKEHDLEPVAVLLTHHHPDHTGAVRGIVKEKGCPVYIHEADAKYYPGADRLLKDGEAIELKNGDETEELLVINTPGHTKGSICFYCDKSRTVFTGDTLFSVEVGRSDLEDSGRIDLALSLGDIVDKWPDDMTVYPGHGDITTMADVRLYNVDFIQAMERYRVFNSDYSHDAEIKLVALDLDGTTMNSENALPAENKKILEAAIAQGVNVVIASGRCYEALPKEVTEIKGVQYAISSNGAMVKDIRYDEVLYSNCADPRAVHMLHDIVKENGYDIEVFVDGRAYMERAKWEEIRDGKITYRRKDYIMTTRNPIDGILDFMMEHDDKVENVNIFFGDLSVKPAIRKTLEPLEEYATITTSFDTNWEMGGKTTSKAQGLKVLCEKLGIKKEEMMSFGDSPNDIPMIEAAGIGVAVGNAKDSVKEVADFITTSNDDAGVAVAVRKFALK